jgi:hypothetical protein
VGRFFAAVVTWLGAISSLDWLWHKLNVKDPPVIWAFTVATFFAVAYLGWWLCAMALAERQTRIDDCANAKKRLE